MQTTSHPGLAVALAATLAFTAPPILAQGPLPEETYPVVVLDNGRFLEQAGPVTAEPAGRRVPWWSGPIEASAVKRQADVWWLKLDRLGQIAEQPFYVYAPYADGLIVRGMVRGHYPDIALVDGRGGVARVELERQLEPKAFIQRPESIPFELTMGDFEAALGRPLEPRLTLRLGPVLNVRHTTGFVAPDKVYWTDLQVLAPMPLPTPQALRAEILLRLDEIFTSYFELALDRGGPRETGFVGQGFDVVTGEPLRAVPGGWIWLWDYVLEACELEPRESWRLALDRFLTDYLELGLHPDTGLPRRWDCERDVPLDAEPVQPAPDLRFLLDVSERGPEPWRERALAAARRLGEAILEHGALPDGSLAPRYVPATGAYDLDVPHVRFMNLPAQLGRLGAVAGDRRFTDAARRALAELEFIHHWGGSWDRLDPDFDDTFGTFAEGSVTLLRHHPDDPVFGRVVASGWEHFRGPWRDALRHGGSVAADQVRCWSVLADYARLVPDVREELAPLLGEAARAHLKGQQVDGGGWSDVTHVRWAPPGDLGVGDLPGAPAMLLWGLAELHAPDLDLPERSVRALFTAVLRSTLQTYGRPHGMLSTRIEREGANPCGAELRMCRGLVTMLRTL